MNTYTHASRAALTDLLCAPGGVYCPLSEATAARLRGLGEGRIAVFYAPYNALVTAGLATRAPLGDELYEYKVTPEGIAFASANPVGDK